MNYLIMIGQMIMNKERIINYLNELFINPKCELEYTKDYELLIAIVMSAQTTDKRVNMVNKVLFKKYQSVKELSEASLEDIEKIIKPIGTYKKIANILIDKKEDKTLDNSDIFSIFEKEFGRTISSMECQIIKGWIDDGFSHELIMEALKEAIYNGVTSLRYIEKILYEWRKKGYKNKKDIQEAKEKYRESKKETKDYFFYDWINDD